MKQLLIIIIAILFSCKLVQAQTYANIAGPENVLVVYNNNDDSLGIISNSVKNYYVDARNIPGSNVVGLDSLVSKNITVDGVTHPVILADGGNIIRDSLNHEWDTWFATQHAWKYYYQYVATPIKEWIVNHNLTSTIRYIVLCKGVPYKIQACGDHGSAIGNIGVDGLLCLLNTNNYETLLDSMYTKWRRYAHPDYTYWDYDNQMVITNPYEDVSQYLNMNYRFKPEVYTRTWDVFTVKLDYLVSHLDGTSYDMVKGIIDRSTEAIHSSDYDWFIDADPIPCLGGSIMVSFANAAASALNSIGFLNYSFDTTEDTVTYHNKPVMSYSSNGVHTTLGPYHDPDCYNPAFSPDYIQSQLNFEYAPGAIFNTAESYNAERLSSITRHPGAEMGQTVEFFLEGGTLAVGHPYEPFTSGIVEDGRMFPAYQLGYSFVDAVYLGMPYLAWQNVVVGDPLTTIAWGKQTTTHNFEMTSTNLVTDTIHISPGDTVTFGSNSTINLKRHGFVTSSESSVLTLGSNVTLISDCWNRGVLLAHSKYNPQLIWAANPSMSPIGYYKIFREFDSEGWIEVDSVTENTWIDSSLTFQKGNGVYHDSVFYYVKSYNNTSTSDPSNTVAAKLGTTVSTSLVNGWQLISVPVIRDDYSADSVFPTHIGSIYAYDNGYVEAETLENGPGYWAKFGSDQTVYHSGLAIDTLSIPVPSGWSFLGSISYDVLVGNICTEPSGIISSIYRFDPVYGYVLLGDGALIRPGIGYWLNVNQSGDVIFSGTCGMQKGTTLSEINLADLDKFIITDSLGRQQSLYVANIDIDSTLAGFDRSMPPAMPELGLDARFNYGEFIKTVSADSGLVNLQIDVESIAYPVTLTWEINPENGIEYSFINDSTLGKMSKLQNNGKVKTLSKNTKGKLRLFGKVSDDFVLNQIPKEFTLYQNYPNPFNPTTTIKYALPKNGFVTLEVYDILGAKVAQLVNQQQKAGSYKVEFNASKLSSGVYLYKITSGSFSDTKKMLLIK